MRGQVGFVSLVAVAGLAASFSPPAQAASLPNPGAASAQTLKLPAGPGSVRGLATDPSVSTFTGQMTYSVPVQVPAAPGGFAPRVTLDHDGGLGNGPLGVGWRLSFPRIERSTRLGVPRYTADDELELGGVEQGGRLVRLADGSYRVSGQGQRVKLVASGSGFVATDGDGRVYAFGTSAASRLESGGRIAAWLPESITDVAGQRIAFTYTRHDGQVYLSSIVWGPGAVFRADFTYSTRPDATVSFRTGFRVGTAQRLTEIRVKAFGELRGVHRLAYEDGLPLSRLASVTQLGRDEATAWPATSFGYAQRDEPERFELTGGEGWVVGQAGVSLLDVDGDGVTDLVKMGGGAQAWRRNQGGSFGPARPLTGSQAASLEVGRLVDLDGDARPELARIDSGAWQVQKLRGELFDTSFAWAGTTGLPLFDASGATVFADVDGDQRIDVLQASGSGLAYYQDGASGFAPRVTRGPVSATFASVAPGKPGVRFLDANGDGLDDVVWLAPDGVRVFLGRGDATFEAQPLVAYPWTSGSIDPDQLHLADLDRDGQVDLVRFFGADVELYLGRAGGFDPAVRRIAQPSGIGALASVTIADVNGNGSQDLVWCSTTRMFALDLAGATEAGMLATIDNGLGKVVSVLYEASGVLAVRDQLAGSAWGLKLPTSIPVVTSLSVSPGADEPAREQRFTVRDAVWDGAERRFAGFLQGTTTTAPGTPLATVQTTRYLAGLGAARVLRGLVQWSKLEIGGQTVNYTENSWEARAVQGLPADQPLLFVAAGTRTRTLGYEGLTTPVETVIETVFDSQVRPIEERRLGRTDVVGDESTIVRSYASDDTTWVRDRVIEEKTLGANGAVLADQQTLYGDDHQILPFGQVGRGWVRAQKQLLDWAGSQRWVVTHTATYDALGNVTGGLDRGVVRRVEYQDGLYAARETAQPAAGRTLEWRQTWDRVLGVPTSITDASGAVTTMSYDAIGRLESVARGARLPHLVYQYDWRAPRPETVTWEWMGAPDDVTPVPAAWSADSGWRRRVQRSNGAGEPVLTATQLGASRWIVDELRVRNARGLTVTRALPFYADGATPPTTLPAQAPRETIVYDALDRAVDQMLPDGTHRRHDYTAVSRTTRADGLAPVVSRYDGQGRIVRTARTVAGLSQSVDVAYDAAGRLTSLSLQDGQAVHRFTYDTLGRLRQAEDPDLGVRHLDYDDADRLTRADNAAGQWLTVAWDAVGRPLSATTSEGAHFVYHYDEARAGFDAGYVGGRLGWVEEPTGEVAFGYGEAGERTRYRRTVAGVSFEERTRFAATGDVLGVSWDDGLELVLDHDAAGRLIRVGDVWRATELDAGGRVLGERFGNGAVETYARDAQGRVTDLKLTSGGQVRLDLGFTRNPTGALAHVTDRDGVGRDQAADLDYDAAGRLVSAVLGSGADAFHFGYGYDGLGNMVSRDATGPASLALLAGDYRYGEGGAGPRQLTSIVGGGAAGAAATTSFDYDAAGRQIAQAGRSMAFDALDHLTRVVGADGELVSYGYGHDGFRTTVTSAAGTQIWFTPQVNQTGGVREHYVTVGDRQVARLTVAVGAASAAGAGAATAGAGLGRNVALGVLLLALVVLAVLVARAPVRRVRVRAGAVRFGSALTAWSVLALSIGSCAAPGGGELSERRSAVTTPSSTIYFHDGATAGPAVITRADGSVVDERRFEPFGAPIAADLSTDPTNSLGKPTDVATGWSYHGARWMAPETARWLAPDPLVKAPDARFLEEPWELNPYAYASQNPVAFWDPDGKQSVPMMASGAKAAQYMKRLHVWTNSDHVIGQEPGEVGSYKFAKLHLSNGQLGVSFGAAGMSVNRDGAQGVVLGVSGHFGKTLTAGGHDEYGLHLEGGLFNAGTSPGGRGSAWGWLGWSLTAFYASLDVSASWERLSFSGGYTIGGITGTMGKFAKGSADWQLSGGISHGGGFALGLRLYPGGADEDGDGLREVGAGIDFAWWSVDFKHEWYSWAYREASNAISSALE